MNFTAEQLNDLRTMGVTFFEAGTAEVVGENQNGLDVLVELTDNCSFKVYVSK